RDAGKHQDATEVRTNHAALENKIQRIQNADHDQRHYQIAEIPRHRLANGTECGMLNKFSNPHSSFINRFQTFSCATAPSKPEGRKRSIKIKIANATASLYVGERYPTTIVSVIPISRPPSTAPGILPIPPSTAATISLRPTRIPIRGSIRGILIATSTPAAAASAEPSAKVKAIIRSVFIPISLADWRLNETARIARPVFVR